MANAQMRPYLCLRARLSQAWISETTVLIMYALARLIIFQNLVGSLMSTVANAMLRQCRAANQRMSQLLDAQQLAAKTANKIIIGCLGGLVSMLKSILLTILIATENLILFIINLVFGKISSTVAAFVQQLVQISTILEPLSSFYFSPSVSIRPSSLHSQSLSYTFPTIATVPSSCCLLLTNWLEQFVTAETQNSIFSSCYRIWR